MRTAAITMDSMDRSNFRRVGLARALSKLGYCSRSRASELIRAGQVTLRGRVRRDPETPVDLTRDEIEVDGQRIVKSHKTYLMMNKPRAVVTTASDEKSRATVYDLLSQDLPWVGPVGRLDRASEGLLLLTNDSEWGQQLLCPAVHLDKTYHVQIGMLAGPEFFLRLEKGVSTADHEFLRVKHARLLRSGKRNSWVEIVLDEGRNRHIRRMLAELGAEVLRLIRVAIGPLRLGNLAKGAYRDLTKEEKAMLDQAMARQNVSFRPS